MEIINKTAEVRMQWEGPKSFLLFPPLFFPYLQCSVVTNFLQISYLSCHHAVSLELKPLGFLLSIRLCYLGSVLRRANRLNLTLSVNQICYNWERWQTCNKKWPLLWKVSSLNRNTLIWQRKRETFWLLHGCTLATVSET